MLNKIDRKNYIDYYSLPADLWHKAMLAYKRLVARPYRRTHWKPKHLALKREKQLKEQQEQQLQTANTSQLNSHRRDSQLQSNLSMLTMASARPQLQDTPMSSTESNTIIKSETAFRSNVAHHYAMATTTVIDESQSVKRED